MKRTSALAPRAGAIAAAMAAAVAVCAGGVAIVCARGVLADTAAHVRRSTQDGPAACAADSHVVHQQERLTASPGERVEPVTGMVFIEIPAGRVVMGSPPDEPDREAQETQHEVVISRGFRLGKHEVTQAEWQAVMGTAPSWFEGDPDLPVERVTWHEVQQFLAELGRRSPPHRFRLPTKAEWEYACRAGATTAYPWGSRFEPDRANVDDRLTRNRVAHDANARDGDGEGATGRAGTADGARPAIRTSAYRGRTTRVGTYPPNAWGLHDMTGNVWEGTADEHCPYTSGPVTDPRRSCGSGLQVIRGGSWFFVPDSARCALRYTHRPVDRGFSLGFRVAIDPPETYP